MIVEANLLETHFSGRRVAVVYFNKDARSLLRAHAAGIAAFPFSIDCVIDPTLRYRPRVYELAQQVAGAHGRVFADVRRIEELVRARSFDAVLIFETGYEDQLQDHLFEFDEPQIESLEALDAKCEADFRNYERADGNAEFNARWSKYAVQFLSEYFSQNHILVVNAYNALIESVNIDQDHALSFLERHAILPTIPPSLSEVPVRFILGEDWACGKTSYLVDQMRKGSSGLAGDFWFRFVSADAIPSFQMQDMFAIKGVIANLVRRAHDRNPGRPVYVKLDGRLEEFVFGIPRDRTYLVKDVHRFFRDCRFVVVHKADSARMRDLVGRFIRKYELEGEFVDRVRAMPDGSFEDLGRLEGLPTSR